MALKWGALSPLDFRAELARLHPVYIYSEKPEPAQTLAPKLREGEFDIKHDVHKTRLPRCGAPFSGSVARPCMRNDTSCGAWTSKGNTTTRSAGAGDHDIWWSPHHCEVQDVSAAQARQCLGNRTLAFVGDSQIRDLGFAVANLLMGNDSVAEAPTSKYDKTWGGLAEAQQPGTRIPDFPAWLKNVPPHNFNGRLYPAQRTGGKAEEDGATSWQVQIWNLYALPFQRHGQLEDVLSNRMAGTHSDGTTGHTVGIRAVDLFFLLHGLHDQGYWWDPPFGRKYYDAMTEDWRKTQRKLGPGSVWVAMNPEVSDMIGSTALTKNRGDGVDDPRAWQARMVEEANAEVNVRFLQEGRFPYWDAAAPLRSPQRRELSADGVHVRMFVDVMRAKMLFNHLCTADMRWRGGSGAKVSSFL